MWSLASLLGESLPAQRSRIFQRFYRWAPWQVLLWNSEMSLFQKKTTGPFHRPVINDDSLSAECVIDDGEASAGLGGLPWGKKKKRPDWERSETRVISGIWLRSYFLTCWSMFNTRYWKNKPREQNPAPRPDPRSRQSLSLGRLLFCIVNAMDRTVALGLFL